ncbi:DUF6887 family protein [Geminocystis sp. NIES-3708]|uniref:DUF6887 family protein n=1 Tax=Geminocystis sp. NIES-3708 TaxID=1615909 RepID=UPI0008336A33|nr:hypothetical protein [Geminocystis sp. NIES-3708]
MSDINYTTMSDEALKKYFLAHKNNPSALHAYLDRKNQQQRKVITKVGDPDFDLKIEKAIQAKLQKQKNQGEK